MLRKLLMLATIVVALLSIGGGMAQAASGPPGYQPCKDLTPWTPTFDWNVQRWDANGSYTCPAVQSDLFITACMFIGDNPNIEFCKDQQFNHVNGSYAFHIYAVTPCFASGFHWVGTRLYTKSRWSSAYPWTAVTRSPDGSGSYGQCRV